MNHFFISGVVLCCFVLCPPCVFTVRQPRRRPGHPRMDGMFTPAFVFSYCFEYCRSGKHTRGRTQRVTNRAAVWWVILRWHNSYLVREEANRISTGCRTDSPGMRRVFLEKPIWAMSTVSCVVNVNSLITDLHSHFNGLIDCCNGWETSEEQAEGRLQMRGKESRTKNSGVKQIENLRKRQDGENERGGSYSRLGHDVNDNEAGTVIVEQLLLQVYLKLLQHGRALLLRGSWGKEIKIPKFSKGLSWYQCYEGQTSRLEELVN